MHEDVYPRVRFAAVSIRAPRCRGAMPSARSASTSTRLRSLMDDFQWFLIDENLEPALNFLTALKAHWRQSVAAPATKPAQRKARG